MTEMMIPRNQLLRDFNSDAVNTVMIEHAIICRRNVESWPNLNDGEELQACGGCSILLPQEHRSIYCGSNCPSLGTSLKIRTLSINMGLSYLFPMASLVKQYRLTPIGFEGIIVFLYDNHFGVDDLRKIWPKIEADFVYRNPKLLKL